MEGYTILNMLAGVPATGDGARPWIAAVILIVSVLVLIGLFVLGKRPDKQDDTFQDEDEDLKK